MLTTIDNPYSPFDQFEEWDAFDRGRGYHTCSYLDRVMSPISPLTTDSDLAKAIAIIVDQDPLGVYEQVFRKDFKPDSIRRKRFAYLAAA